MSLRFMAEAISSLDSFPENVQVLNNCRHNSFNKINALIESFQAKKKGERVDVNRLEIFSELAMTRTRLMVRFPGLVANLINLAVDLRGMLNYEDVLNELLRGLSSHLAREDSFIDQIYKEFADDRLDEVELAVRQNCLEASLIQLHVEMAQYGFLSIMKNLPREFVQ